MKYRREKCRECDGKGRVPGVVWVRAPPDVPCGAAVDSGDVSACEVCDGTGRALVALAPGELAVEALEGLLAELRKVREALRVLALEAVEARKDRRAGWVQRHRADCPGGAAGCACPWGPP